MRRASESVWVEQWAAMTARREPVTRHRGAPSVAPKLFERDRVVWDVIEKPDEVTPDVAGLDLVLAGERPPVPASWSAMSRVTLSPVFGGIDEEYSRDAP